MASSSSNEKKRKFKRICVFCGSRAGYKSSFSEAALELGKELVRYIDYFFILLLSLVHVNFLTGSICLAINYLQVERKIDLVYGGGSAGLMGLISKTVFNGGCHVLG